LSFVFILLSLFFCLCSISFAFSAPHPLKGAFAADGLLFCGSFDRRLPTSPLADAARYVSTGPGVGGFFNIFQYPPLSGPMR